MKNVYKIYNVTARCVTDDGFYFHIQLAMRHVQQFNVSSTFITLTTMYIDSLCQS